MGRPSYRHSSAKESEDGAPPSAQAQKLNKQRVVNEEHRTRFGKTYGTNRIGTEHWRTRMRRVCGRPKTHSILFLLIGAVFTLGLPARWREILAAHLRPFYVRHHAWKERDRFHYKTMSRTVRTMWANLSMEANAMVRYYSLMFMDAVYSSQNPLIGPMPVAFMLDTLEETPNFCERVVILKMLQNIVQYSFALFRSYAEKCIDRLAQYWMELIENRGSRSIHLDLVLRGACWALANAIEQMGIMSRAVRHDSDVASVVGVLLSNAATLPFFQEQLRRPENQLPEENFNPFSMLLKHMLKAVPTATRAAALRGAELRSILALLRPRDISSLSHYPEVWAVIVSTPSILYVICEKARLESLKPTADSRFEIYGGMLLSALHRSINDRVALQQILGLGCLPMVAAYYSKQPQDEYVVSDAALFRRVLNQFPEWKKRFKEATNGGANSIARLGASLVIRPPKPAQYILEEDVDDI